MEKEDVSNSIRQLEAEFTEVTELSDEYKATMRTKSMFAFWEEYLSMVNILQFIKVERTADWSYITSSLWIAQTTPGGCQFTSQI